MFLFFSILSLLFAGLHFEGEFSVLHSPKSMAWTGEDQLESVHLGSVLMATQGHAVDGDSEWSGLSIKDPFAVGQAPMVVVHVKGFYHVPVMDRLRVYDLLDSDTEASLSYFINQLKPGEFQDFSFYKQDVGEEKFKYFLKMEEVPIASPIHYLKPVENTRHREFLTHIGCLKVISSNLTDLWKAFPVIIIRFSVDRIAKAGKNEVVLETKSIITEAVDQLLKSARNISDNFLLLMTTERVERSDGATFRSSRVNKTNPFAKFSKVEQPVLFNIFLWLSLALALSIAVTSYFIINMDPGRETVLYRMSRTYKGQAQTKKQR